jgi:arsenate reductase
MTMRHPKTVLVLCTGNSCRSQMGEAILNHELAGLVRGISAGTSPQAKVADGAIRPLRWQACRQKVCTRKPSKK